jgi:hypothetical protein
LSIRSILLKRCLRSPPSAPSPTNSTTIAPNKWNKNNGASPSSEYFHEPTSQLAKLHAKLDAIALEAYGWNAKDNLLKKLLELNLELAEKEKSGEAIVGSWAPEWAIGWAEGCGIFRQTPD